MIVQLAGDQCRVEVHFSAGGRHGKRLVQARRRRLPLLEHGVIHSEITQQQRIVWINAQLFFPQRNGAPIGSKRLLAVLPHPQ